MTDAPTATDNPGNLTGSRIHITGIVQGVGFRPFVFNLATRFALAGWVLNSSSGVEIEAYGAADALASFLTALQAEAPPLASLDQIETQPIPILPANLPATFEIRHSQSDNADFSPVPPDICICDDCLRELLDPADRRFRYPFINCTNCGPRFTLIRDLPYDRPLTTMADFGLCDACRTEYEDPADRRFHAQPNACPTCGPHLTFMRSGQTDNLAASDEQALKMAQKELAEGGIVAVKGLGGFHLACDATNLSAVAELRERKGRVDKPFAVMVADLESAGEIAQISPGERALLTGRARPIVLLATRRPFPLAEAVSPNSNTVGVMLPYTPLHYLLLDNLDLPALVMTSGNLSEEPIVSQNADAVARLSGLADAFLLHNRDIHMHCDDSVVRIFQGDDLPIRRARGYAPYPVPLRPGNPSVLAVGGELKNTFCMTRGPYAFMSQHLGDMQNLETLRAFEHAVDHFVLLFRVTPKAVACDMHPTYLATRWAEEYAQKAGVPLVHVQHHHAHIASVMADAGMDGVTPVIGFSFDGTGYGVDGAIWGGEVLISDYAKAERVAHLKYVPLPGGDAATRHPYRMALAHLWAAGVGWHDDLPPVTAATSSEQRIIRRQLEAGLNAPLTSSMGRLFDAVASLAGARQSVSYEGQAALGLEALVTPGIADAYAFDLQFAVAEETAVQAPCLIDSAPVIQSVASDVLAGLPIGVIAARFHNAVVEMVVQIARWQRDQQGLKTVALSGGVFQNVTLLEKLTARLAAEGFDVITHRRVPPNDGGLALGQAVIAQTALQE